MNSQTGTFTNADIDIRLFSQNGREAIKHDLLIMADLFSNGMPKENSTNPIEAGIGKTLNFLGDITFGIIPSNKNKGGIMGELGTTIVADPNFKILGDKNSNNVFIPGIMTKEDMAYSQANHMMGDDYKIYYNPTRGLIADLAESAFDFLGGTSGIAKQVGYEMKNNPNNNYVSFSQGTLISKSGMNYYCLKENMVYVGTPLYRNFDNGVNVNSNLDPVHNPLVIFNPNSWKNKQYGSGHGLPILYEHVWSPDYKNIINNIKDKNE